jgi:hypothetical protein
LAGSPADTAAAARNPHTRSKESFIAISFLIDPVQRSALRPRHLMHRDSESTLTEFFFGSGQGIGDGVFFGFEGQASD